MDIISSYIFLDIINVFLLLFFVIFLITLRKGSRSSNLLLAAFLFSLAMSYMDGVFISFSYFFYRPYPYIVHLTRSFDFLIGPLLFFYLLSLTSRAGAAFQIRPKQVWHFAPFVLHLLLLAVIGVRAELSRGEVVLLAVASSLHISIYILLTLYTLSAFRKKLKGFFADETPYSFSWLVLVASGLFFVGLLRFSNNILWIYYPESSFHDYIDLKVFDVLGVFAFACTLVLYSLREPLIFHWGTMPTLEKTIGNLEKKYETSALDDATSKEAQSRIERYMLESKAYLQSDFNLSSLAEAVEMPTHQVSQVLNVHIGRNFFEFVNSYRIQECRRLLQDEPASKSITEIMYDVGFSSKSAFNTAFKRSVGQTPSQYRKHPASA